MSSVKTTLAAGFAALALAACQCLAPGPDVKLAIDGKTDYVIVKPANPTVVDDYAVGELAHYLGEITGAEFAVVKPGELGKNQRAVFVGVSAPMKKRLGENDPLADLKNEEHVCRTSGEDVFLYGDPPHGNKDAVFAFLEDLGWRWFSVFEHPVVPSKPTLVLKPFNKTLGFDFPYRKISVTRNMDFPYQHGANLGFGSRKRKIAWRHGKDAVKELSPFVPETHIASSGHTVLRYVPPRDAEDHYDFKWQEKDNYFKTNPDFFTMNENGERVANKQLCFANRGLRDELTKNLLKHIELEGGADREVIVAVGANDTPGKFCHCPECLKLEEQYGGPGGPIFDYLLEACPIIKEKFPKAKISTFAYRRGQTQEPPKLPDGVRLPDNLIIDFAPIDDNYFADWTHPDPEIQDTYDDLKKWCEMSDNVWCWIYPNPWRTGAVMPVGNVERLINNVRLMKDAGVKRVFADHNGAHQRSGFSELQKYLLLKLMKDADQDETVLIKEFTDNLYGPAAPMFRKYLTELEECRKTMKLPPDVRYKSQNYDDVTFPYLTPENIHRWETYFDEMEKTLEGQPKRMLNNVRLARRELDLAALWKWFDLQKEYPDAYQDHKVLVDRIESANQARLEPWTDDGNGNRTAWEKESGKSFNRKLKPLGGGALRDFAVLIEAGGKEKPLPKEFKGIDKSKIKTFVPEYGKNVLDEDAALGYAIAIHMPDAPFHFGFHSSDDATKDPAALPKLPPNSPAKWGKTLKGTYTLERQIKKNEISPGEYKPYRLETIKVTPNSRIWFSNKSWRTSLDLGKRLYEPGEANTWDAYASLKFNGPSYGGKAKQDQVLCDRIILVRKGKD